MKKENKKIKVLMLAAEVAPFAKVGGLGDVAGSLPPALKKAGVDVRVMMPLYGSIDRKKYKLKKIYSDLEVPSGWLMIKVNIWESKMPGTRVPIYFIDAPEYYKYDEVYVSGDNSERFLFFSLAALYCLPLIKFNPDVVHCHDSHTALVPDIIKTSNLDYIRNLKTLLTIHNFEYQGKANPLVLSTGNLHPNSLKVLSKDVADGDVNFMVQGVLGADLINTVSKKYAEEILTSTYGAGLDNIIQKRKKDLFGILNGIDVDFFNASKDEYISQNFSIRSLDKKSKNKTALQKRLGLQVDKNIPMVGLVSRLVWQKGLELITDRFGKLDCQFVFLGNGQKQYEEQLKAFAKKFPENVSANITFDLKLAQQIYASSDIFLMPSRFEPCGLGQMIAMHYGTVPVVRATGGLADTVDDKVGFSFQKMEIMEFYNTLKEAIDLYHEKPLKWRKLQENCMKRDFSWERSAREYVGLYKKILSNRKKV